MRRRFRATLRKTGFAAKYESAREASRHACILGLRRAVAPRRDRADAARGCARRAEAVFGNARQARRLFRTNAGRASVSSVRASRAPPFRALARGLREAYAGLGFEFERIPVAHVTIARVKDSKRPLPPIEFAPISLAVTALTLFESLPDPREDVPLRIAARA